MADPNRPVRRWRRLILRAFGLLVLLVVGLIAALPWLASAPQARNYAVDRINAILAPSRVEVGSVGLSWIGSTRLGGLVVRDPAGKVVLKADRLTLDRSLSQLLRDRSDLGTLTVEGAAIDVERRADGSIDILDVLPRPKGPVPPPTSEASGPPSIAVKIVAGTLTFKGPELPDGLSAERLDLDLKAPAGGPIRISATLANPSKGESLEVVGAFGAGIEPGAPAGLDATVKGTRWPWAVASGGVVARGRLEGRSEVRRRGDSMALRGDARLIGLDATGPALAGDRIQLSEVTGAWEADCSGGVWSAKSISWKSPVGSVDAQGSWPPSPTGTTTLSAVVDLAAISKQAPHLLRLQDGIAIDRGSAHLTVLTAEAVAGAQPLAIEAKISEIAARDAGKEIRLREPATLSALVLLGKAGFEVERLEAKAGFLDLKGSGGSAEGIKAVADVDLAGLEGQLRDLVDFGGLSMAGKGRLSATFTHLGPVFAADLEGDLKGFRVSGVFEKPVEAESLRIAARAKGPAGADGIPGGYEMARVRLESLGDWLDAEVNHSGGDVFVGLSASCPVPPVGPEARTDSRLIFRWAPPEIEIRDLHVGLKPAVAQPGAAISARGRFDTAKGELVLSAPEKFDPVDTLFLLDGGLRASGLGGPASGLGIEANLSGELALIDRTLAGWTGGAPWDFSGKLQGFCKVGPDLGVSGRKIALLVAGSEVVRSASDPGSRTTEGSFGFEIKGALDRAGLAVEALNVSSRYGALIASGRVDDPTGSRKVDLKGVIDPNWRTIDAILASAVEPGASIRGNPRPFRLRGALSAGDTKALLSGLEADLGLDLTEIRAMGVKVGPAPLVFRAGGGAWSIDPIRTTINGGIANIMPALAIDDQGAATLSILRDSSIRNAAVDADVAHSILSFVAPVLVDATEVGGRVSAAVESCEIPLWGGPAGRSLKFLGPLVFDDLTFGPGPLAGEIADFAAPGKLPRVRLRQVLAVSVADGRVGQTGLSIPLGVGGSVEISGSVGLDTTLDLRAEVPLPTDRLARKLQVTATKTDMKVPIPIRGTLARPEVDRRALARAIEAAGRQAIERNARGVESELLKRLGGPERPGRPDVGGLLEGLGRGGSGGTPR